MDGHPAEAEVRKILTDVNAQMADQEAADIVQELADQAIAPIPEAEVAEVKMVQVAEEVIAVHLPAGAEVVLQGVQIADQLHEVLMAVVIVEEEEMFHHQEATIVLPAMVGEPAEGKVALPHAAGKIIIDPATRK